MNKTLTLAQIQSRFDSEWVLVAEPEVDEQLRVVRGRVVCHSKDRDEVDRKMIELRLKSFATLYTGRMPDNTAIVLCRGRAHAAAVGDGGWAPGARLPPRARTHDRLPQR